MAAKSFTEGPFSGAAQVHARSEMRVAKWALGGAVHTLVLESEWAIEVSKKEL